MSHMSVGSAVPALSERRWTAFVLTGLVLSAALHPVSADDFWWQLSRGRAVANGELAPSRSLLAGDLLAEADWLGGLPFFTLYELGGLFALMLLKLAVVSGLVAWSRRTGATLGCAARWLVTVGLTLVAVQACEPTPALWDVLCLLIASGLVERMRRRFTVGRLIGFGGLACAWANLAPGCLLIVLPLAEHSLRPATTDAPKITARAMASLLGMALLGLSLTPRGVFTIWDSARQLVPLLVESPEILRESPWHPLWSGNVDSLMIGWLMLMLMAVVVLIRMRRDRLNTCPATPHPLSNGLLLAGVVSLGWWSRPNAVVLSVWLVQWIAANTVSGIPANGFSSRTVGRMFARLVPCACLLMAVGLSLGVPALTESRLGWGLHRRLEDRLLEGSLGPASSKPASVPDSSRQETAHCTDVRAAGMLAWLRPSHSKPFLVSQRALLNGRLREEVLLNRELETGWLKQHRRADGTAGGWWLTLRARHTSLLVCSAERTRLIQSLQPTIWKPLSIDSPVIPCALAGDPRFAPRIAEVRLQQQLVDRGAWVFQPEPVAGNDRIVDLIGWATGQPDPEPILRQSAVLRAMNLPLAAARVLRPLLPVDTFSEQVRREWVASQRELAHREFLTTGQVGEFRHRVLDALGVSLRQSATSTAEKSAAAVEAVLNWSPAVSLYLAGNPHAAAELLKHGSAAMMSASAMLEWEAGRPDEANAIWHALRQKFPRSRYSLASRQALEAGDY